MCTSRVVHENACKHNNNIAAMCGVNTRKAGWGLVATIMLSGQSIGSL